MTPIPNTMGDIRNPSLTTSEKSRKQSAGTIYGKTFSYYTKDVLPRLGYYKNVVEMIKERPTLDELRNEALFSRNYNELEKQPEGCPEDPNNSTKFGWIEGVLVRCMLNIWGVMLFLRLSWVVAQAGIGLSLVIILLSATVTTLTALSMSAISTNGEIKGGGIYYMVSRALGPEFGGALGAIFSFTNATAVAMHTVGFAESLNDLLKSLQVKIIDNSVNDIRIVGTIALIVMQAIIVIGMEWESKAQIVLLFILLIAIGDFLLGAFIGPLDNEEIAKGYLGLNATIFSENFLPDYRPAPDGTPHSFFSIFSIFFPAATGIAAGANISGDLRDPGMAIPRGTLGAILITTLSYIVFAILAGSATLRDASGIFNNSTEIDYSLISNCTNCPWGSQNSFQIMELMSIFGPVIYAGCFAATLSSALACLVSAPKIFQALCKDKLYPGIEIFAKGYWKNGDPLLSYGLAFLIALAFILIADLNAIAPLISNFFMMSYIMVHLCVLHAEIVRPCGWRPAFKYFNAYTSGLGLVMCIAIMFLMNSYTALITIGIIMTLFFALVYIKPDVNWGSSTQASSYSSALHSVQALNNEVEHVKNYRPHILLLSGSVTSRPALVDLAYLITKNVSMLICGHVIQERLQQEVRLSLQNSATKYLEENKMKSFYNLVDDVEQNTGTRFLIQSSGVGKLRPNIVFMGFKSDWNSCPRKDFQEYYKMIIDVRDNNLALILGRMRNGFDTSELTAESPAKIYFRTKQAKGVIDVWWISNESDGGLTLLIAYIISNRRIFKGSKLRVYIIPISGKKDIDASKLFDKLRIPYLQLILIKEEEFKTKPKEASEKSFADILFPIRNEDESCPPIPFPAETNRFLRLREMVQEYSWQSNMIVMTLPLIERIRCYPSHIFMAWIDCLTNDLPPIILIKGNGNDVLTYNA